MDAKAHLFEKFEAFLDWPVSELGWDSIVSVFSHNLDRFSTNKGISLLNQLNGKIIESIKIVTCMSNFPRFISHE